jgi:DNA-binding Lrp family transcriptional regulator
LSKTDKRIIELLSENGPLTLAEISERLEMKPKAVFRALRRLFEKGVISSDPATRRYFIENDEQ